MTQDEFWHIIEKGAHQELAGRDVESLAAFHRLFWERMAESYRWDLWAVAYIVNGGCSDDGFDYFRGWLIAQGRAYYEAALQDPRRAADRARPDECEDEEMLSAAFSLYEKKTGRYPDSSISQPAEPAGTAWEEEDLETLYPDLWARFG